MSDAERKATVWTIVVVGIAAFYWLAGQNGLSFWEFSVPVWVVIIGAALWFALGAVIWVIAFIAGSS